VGAKGISPGPDKVKAIVAQPSLTNQTEIRSFMGMIGFLVMKKKGGGMLCELEHVLLVAQAQ